MNHLGLETERLILRRWRPSDLKPFAALNADPRVMEHFPSTLTEDETALMIQSLEDRFDKNGFSFWAAELKATQEFIGFVGLNRPGYETPFTPCVEVGWRLAYEHWGKGYAPEAALATLEYGFEKMNLDEIVSFTSESNLNSQRVMQKIGMTCDPEGGFDHPTLPVGHPLRRHVLYRIRRNPV